MKTIYLPQNVGIIQLDVPESRKAVWMQLDESAGLGKALGRCQQEGETIDLIHFLQELIEHAWLAVEMHVHVDHFGHVLLREHECGRQKHKDYRKALAETPQNSSIQSPLWLDMQKLRRASPKRRGITAQSEARGRIKLSTARHYQY
ncbi:MAG: hypothetical protein ACYCSN_04385 [Acidobacteriaceae bacterium]